MRPLFLKVILFDPAADPNLPKEEREFLVFEGLEAQVVEFQSWNRTVGFNSLVLTPDPSAETLVGNNPAYKSSRQHFVRVDFVKPNSSRQRRMLLCLSLTFA